MFQYLALNVYNLYNAVGIILQLQIKPSDKNIYFRTTYNNIDFHTSEYYMLFRRYMFINRI